LLKELAIPNTNLHAAGNDTHYALCALLMLVVIDAERQGVSSEEGLLRALRSVAQAPRPATRRESEKVERSARLRVKREAKLRRKARRAARTERRKQERERQLATSEEEDHSSDTESRVDAAEQASELALQASLRALKVTTS
jgi:hypothetical protein